MIWLAHALLKPTSYWSSTSKTPLGLTFWHVPSSSTFMSWVTWLVSPQSTNSYHLGSRTQMKVHHVASWNQHQIFLRCILSRASVTSEVPVLRVSACSDVRRPQVRHLRRRKSVCHQFGDLPVVGSRYRLSCFIFCPPARLVRHG